MLRHVPGQIAGLLQNRAVRLAGERMALRVTDMRRRVPRMRMQARCKQPLVLRANAWRFV